MNIIWAVVIVGVLAAVSVTALLLVRRRAPEGGFFEDGDRAAGVFGVLATGFSVLLGFIVFLAFTSYDQVRPQTATQQSAYDKWLEQTSAREEARRDRVHGAVGVIPTTLWIVLFFIAAVIFVFMLFFADSGERAVVQGMLIGSVVSVMALLMLLLYALDNPFHSGVGGLKPVAMERSLRMVDEALSAVQTQVRLPCDGVGEPLPS